MTLPVVDLSLAASDASGVADQIDRAARDDGFFLVVGHGVPSSLRTDLDAAARAFFALDEATKAEVAMPLAGRAWRGWFPLGAELTSGQPDHKEGLYFGVDHPGDHPRVVAGDALHGMNRYPAQVPALAALVPRYVEAVVEVAQQVLSLMALALGVGEAWFREGITADPTVLFRIFRYPSLTSREPTSREAAWSVGEHTDYGLLTVLGGDGHGGLQVHRRGGWVDVEPHPEAFVCNLGDMLERLTGGTYRSTPHRVRYHDHRHDHAAGDAGGPGGPGADRLSFPLFLDPGWDRTVPALPLGGAALRGRERWDAEEPLAWTGRYGEYLTAKVARVFPELFAATAPTARSSPPASSYADGSTRSTSTSTSSCVVAPDDITTPRSGITSE